MQNLMSNVPPILNNISHEMQVELSAMQQLSLEELLTIAHRQVSQSERERHLQVLEKNQLEALTEKEHIELRNYRLSADKLMLQKACAWAILKQRGYPVPKLEELPEE